MSTVTRWEPETVSAEPYNAQTPSAALAEPITPTGAFFVRDHFGVPRLDRSGWRLRVTGLVATPLDLGYEVLRGSARRELDVVVECAGNGRALMTPRPPGLPWGQRAVGCARFAGVPLREVLAPAGLRPETVELVFTGADRGRLRGRATAFERSLPAAVALHPDTLLATHMNGAPLTAGHGAPVRLVVPGRYGVADVKWLVAVRAVGRPFTGPFQAEEYVYRHSSGTPDGTPEGPVTVIRVKSLITWPEPGARLPAGRPESVRGKAWSGGGAPVGRVEVRAGDGPWRPAALAPAAGPYAWCDWSYRWMPVRPGPVRLEVRATDAAGRTQPLSTPWNEQGYGCNPVARVDVEVTAGPTPVGNGVTR
ncbi:molybdopterin-dependent oxidoreductase [Kitasatospora sp. NPDC004240]